uniref:Uncharacterized protein n=1 Tax=Cacopsylla melanoneura TaxID=428564 RepID=A0A8D9A052_9HEMI
MAEFDWETASLHHLGRIHQQGCPHQPQPEHFNRGFDSHICSNFQHQPALYGNNECRGHCTHINQRHDEQEFQQCYLAQLQEEENLFARRRIQDRRPHVCPGPHPASPSLPLIPTSPQPP